MPAFAGMTSNGSPPRPPRPLRFNCRPPRPLRFKPLRERAQRSGGSACRSDRPLQRLASLVPRAALAALVLSCAARGRGAAPAGDMAEIPAGSCVAGTDSAEIPRLMELYRMDHADLFTGEIPRRTVHVAAFAL